MAVLYKLRSLGVVSLLVVLNGLKLFDKECDRLGDVLLGRIPSLTTCPADVFERRPQIEIQTPIVCDLGRLILATLDIMSRIEYILCQLRIYRDLDHVRHIMGAVRSDEYRLQNVCPHRRCNQTLPCQPVLPHEFGATLAQIDIILRLDSDVGFLTSITPNLLRHLRTSLSNPDRLHASQRALSPRC